MYYDLEERTKIFNLKFIKYLRQIKINTYNRNIINQVLRSATSIGANYFEANGSCSKKEFRNKISICVKESRETKYWIELLAETVEDKKELRDFWKEAHELSLIFGRIYTSLNKK